jgi:hypothetical protein
MQTPNTGERPPAANTELQTLLNEHAAARITGLSVASVRRWRVLRQGLYACFGRLAVSAGVEVLRAVVHHVLGKLR